VTDSALPSELKRLLDRSTSKAKRLGNKNVELGHLVLVLIDAGDTSFGPSAADRVTRDLATKPRSYEQPTRGDELTRALSASGTDEPMDTLIPILSEYVATVSTSRDSAVAGSGDVPTPESQARSERSQGDMKALNKAVEMSDYARYAEPLSNLVGFEPVTERVMTLLDTSSKQVPLVVGQRGTGLGGLADNLRAALTGVAPDSPLFEMPVVRLDATAILGSAARGVNPALAPLLDQANSEAVVVVDGLEILLVHGLGSATGSLRAAMARAGGRIVFSITEEMLENLRHSDPEFMSQVEIVRVPTLSEDASAKVVADYALNTSKARGIEIPGGVVSAALTAPRESDNHAHPGLAIRRIDRAVSAARIRAERVAAVADLGSTTSGQHYVGFDRAVARERLTQVVLGQDEAIDAVTRRLAVTRMRLDMRPERPDGVFLFAGPTGTGKTALALALAHEVYGSEKEIIRIDMSEYSDYSTVSKLVGSAPGFVGSTEPDSWLTTRIRKNPQCVLLLDEIEKAHPIVWNTFLQVFDAGRLTDSQGKVADFRDVVIVLTTNIGADEFADDADTGFAPQGTSQGAQREKVRQRLKQEMRPELLNRLDAILVFDPLSEETVRHIARQRLDEALARAASRGWAISYNESVIDYLVERGYSKEYGARPLLRVIEHDVLNPITELTLGKYLCRVDSGVVRFG
jgi:ATP-dependent Clp protease ATP-binding subunit ClpA